MEQKQKNPDTKIDDHTIPCKNENENPSPKKIFFNVEHYKSENPNKNENKNIPKKSKIFSIFIEDRNLNQNKTKSNEKNETIPNKEKNSQKINFLISPHSSTPEINKKPEKKIKQSHKIKTNKFLLKSKAGIIKGHFTREEDEQLLSLHKIYGKKWNLIAKAMKNRTGKQIRDRFLNSLAPGVIKHRFTYEEDLRIIKYYKLYGRAWSSIAKYIKGRTGDMIKNRFYSNLSKNMNKVEDEEKNGKKIQESEKNEKMENEENEENNMFIIDDESKFCVDSQNNKENKTNLINNSNVENNENKVNNGNFMIINNNFNNNFYRNFNVQNILYDNSIPNNVYNCYNGNYVKIIPEKPVMNYEYVMNNDNNFNYNIQNNMNNNININVGNYLRQDAQNQNFNNNQMFNNSAQFINSSFYMNNGYKFNPMIEINNIQDRNNNIPNEFLIKNNY